MKTIIALLLAALTHQACSYAVESNVVGGMQVSSIRLHTAFLGKDESGFWNGIEADGFEIMPQNLTVDFKTRMWDSENMQMYEVQFFYQPDEYYGGYGGGWDAYNPHEDRRTVFSPEEEQAPAVLLLPERRNKRSSEPYRSRDAMLVSIMEIQDGWKVCYPLPWALTVREMMSEEFQHQDLAPLLQQPETGSSAAWQHKVKSRYTALKSARGRAGSERPEDDPLIVSRLSSSTKWLVAGVNSIPMWF